MAVNLLDRKLDERSSLWVEFPQGGDAPPIIFQIPFYENIVVNESKAAKLVRYNPIGRSSPLHSYSSGDAKRFNLSFALTLPHLQFEAKNFSVSRFFNQSVLDAKEQKRQEFLREFPNANVGPAANPGQDMAVRLLATVNEAVHKFFGIDEDGEDVVQNIPQTQTLAVYYWWTNLIRAMVMTNSRSPFLGPPIVRFTHGLLWNSVPCVATDYNIEIDEEAGYELRTMTPRRLLVSLNLEETRSGNFEAFERSNLTTRDNEGGWEAVIEYASTDPGEASND